METMNLKKFRLIFLSLIGMIFLYSILLYLFIYDSNTVTEDDIKNTLYGVVIFLSVSCTISGQLIFNKLKKETTNREQTYLRGCLVRASLLEGSILFSVVIAFAFNLLQLLALSAALLVYLITLFPTDDKYKRDLDLYN